MRAATQRDDSARPPRSVAASRAAMSTSDVLAELISPDEATFASLPLPLARLVFLALPPDARGRACCVCRAWRDVLADPSLWTRLDLSDVQRFELVFLGAASRARGVLCELEVSQRQPGVHLLLPVLTANAGSLRELHLRYLGHSDSSLLRSNWSLYPSFGAVLPAAPLLQVLAVEQTRCFWGDAPRMLHAEPPYAALQMCHYLEVNFEDQGGLIGGMERFGPFAAALADATLQPALSEMRICRADTAEPAVMNALVDAVLARRRLRELRLSGCTPPDAAPLVRLLTGGSLTLLEYYPAVRIPLFDAAGAALVADALRVNTTLTELLLDRAGLCVDMRVAHALLGALIGHPSLCVLRFTSDYAITVMNTEIRSAFGAALAALIAADAPALHVLTILDSSLRDVGLEPIVDALALNHHLRELDVRWNGMSETFARERLLPAVRANTSLRMLLCDESHLGPAAEEAAELVRRRRQHS